MKKGAAFLLVIMFVLSMAECGMIAGAEDMQTAENEVLQENMVSVNLDDVAAQNDPEEQFRNHLEQVAEKEIIGEEFYKSIDAQLLIERSAALMKR